MRLHVEPRVFGGRCVRVCPVRFATSAQLRSGDNRVQFRLVVDERAKGISLQECRVPCQRCWARLMSEAAERSERRRAGSQSASRGTQADGTGAPRTSRPDRAVRGAGTKLSGGGCIGLCCLVLFGTRATL